MIALATWLNTSESHLCCWYDLWWTDLMNWNISMINIQTIQKDFIRWKQNNCTPPLRSLKTFVIPKLANVDPRGSLTEPLSDIQTVSEHPFFMWFNMIKTQNLILKGMNEQKCDIYLSKTEYIWNLTSRQNMVIITDINACNHIVYIGLQSVNCCIILLVCMVQYAPS